MSTYLLNAIREMMIDKIDPSKLSNNLVDGLEQKEKLLSNITEDMLKKYVPNYEELEHRIQYTSAEKLTDVMIGLSTIEDIQMILPDIEFTAMELEEPEEHLYPDNNYHFNVQLKNGTFDLSRFNYEWIETSIPPDSNVTIIENGDEIEDNIRIISFIINFSKPGYYLLNFRLQDSIFEEYFKFQTLNALIIEEI